MKTSKLSSLSDCHPDFTWNIGVIVLFGGKTKQAWELGVESKVHITKCFGGKFKMVTLQVRSPKL